MTDAAASLDAPPHPLFPERTAHERALHGFYRDLKDLVTRELKPRIRREFESTGAAAAEVDDSTLAARVRGLDSFRWYSALARAQHELYVDSTTACVERQAADLSARAAAVARSARLGSLRLDPSTRVPDYQAEADIHCVPGGYFVELGPDDVYAGARYELGISLYTLGRHGAMNDSKGRAGVAFLRERFPGFAPRRILDLGCTCGNSTLPYVEAFPEADVHGLDLSAPALRYAHARAELLERAVHFRQGNAEAAPYDDGSFDLVVSHILLHETSARAIPRIFAECHRLLAPGGVMLHVEVPVRNRDLDVFERFMADWETDYNNEPFWRGLQALDLAGLAVAAGFERRDVFDEYSTAGSRAFINDRPWWLFGALRSGPG